MYFWNIQQLKKDLIAHSITERHKLYYLLIAFLAFQLGIIFELYMGLEWTTGEVVLKGGGLLILCLGLPLCYKANGGDKGRYFLERYLSISWVVGIRSFPVVFVLVLGAIFVEYLVVGDQAFESGTSLALAIFLICVCIGIYWRIIVHLKDVAQHD